MRNPLASALRISFALAAFAAGCGGQWQAGGLGPLSDVVAVGRDGAWDASLDQNVYWLENGERDDAIRYFFTGQPGSEAGSRTVAVDVAVEAGPDSRAGLLYGLSRDPLFYYMVTVEPDGAGALYRRDESGLNLVMASSAPAPQNGFHRLEVRESGAQVEVFVNGSSIGALGSRGVGTGRVGIIAVGSGRFGFTNYAQTPKPAGTPAPAVADAPVPSQRSAQTAPVAFNSPAQQTVSAAAQAGGPTESPAGGMVRLKQFDVVDNQGFGKPVVAMSLLAPADWRLEGGVVWNPQYRCYSDLISTKARLVSPDGRYAFEFFPAYAVQWWDDPMSRNMQAQAVAQGGQGCPVAPPFDSTQFVQQALIPGFRSGARVVDAQPNAEVARAAYEKMMSKEGAVVRQNQMQVDTDAARVRIAYDSQGTPTEEWIVATTFRTVMSTFSASAAFQGQTANSAARYTYTESVFGFRAPKGELDRNERLFSTIIASMRVNPAWDHAVRQTIAQINKIKADGARRNLAQMRESSRKMFDTFNEINEMRRDSWRKQQESSDYLAKKWSQTMRGVNEYSDPDAGASWEIDNSYEHVWKTPLDEFVLTNDPNFNPNVAFNDTGWTQLQQAQ